MTTQTALTFEQMAHIEPRLADVVRFASRSLVPMFGNTFTGVDTAYEYAKSIGATFYVGHNARHPELRSSDCYETFIAHLWKELDL